MTPIINSLIDDVLFPLQFGRNNSGWLEKIWWCSESNFDLSSIVDNVDKKLMRGAHWKRKIEEEYCITNVPCFDDLWCKNKSF